MTLLRDALTELFLALALALYCVSYALTLPIQYAWQYFVTFHDWLVRKP